MLRYSPRYGKLRISIELGEDYTDEERKELAHAVAIYKESPKREGFKSIVKAFIASAKLSTRFISEQNVTKLRRILPSSPSRPTVMLLRQQGLLEGTYTKEVGQGRQGYIIFYTVEKLIKRLAQLETVGYAKAIRFHKQGQLSHLWMDTSEIAKDKAEIRNAKVKSSTEISRALNEV